MKMLSTFVIVTAMFAVGVLTQQPQHQRAQGVVHPPLITAHGPSLPPDPWIPCGSLCVGEGSCIPCCGGGYPPCLHSIGKPKPHLQRAALNVSNWQPDHVLQVAYKLALEARPIACPHQREVDRWYEWRANNPHAHSRFRGGNRELSAYETVSADEEEPDPGNVGGCGCSPEVALASDGCGWWMSQVYGLRRSQRI